MREGKKEKKIDIDCVEMRPIELPDHVLWVEFERLARHFVSSKL